jgi:DNA-directed RNA polymerase specialized sigma24 family protein
VTVDHVSSLERDWRRLVRGLLPERLRAWAQGEPPLAAFAEPARLIGFLRSPAQAASKDAVLRPLVRIARDEPLAARVVLEALAPGLTRLAERVIFDERDRDELWALILEHAWQQIRSYPLERRPSKIAANLILETRRAALTEFTLDRRRRRDLPPRPLTERATAPAGADVEKLLARAIAAGAISADEAELILQTRIDELPLRQLAAEQGIAYHTLNVRRLRAERHLLLFLGSSAVTFQGRKAHWSGARAVGATRTGRITATPPAQAMTGPAARAPAARAEMTTRRRRR